MSWGKWLVALFVVSFFTAAAGVNSFQATGYVDMQFQDRVYAPGEAIPFTLVVQNSDSTVFGDGRVVVHLVKEGLPHFGIAGNDVFGSTSRPLEPEYFVSDMVFRDVLLAAGQTRVINASFQLPLEMRNGDYSFYVYFDEGRTPVLGNEVLFSPGLLKRFTVNGSYGRAVYVSLDSSVEGKFDQEGPTVNTSTVSGIANVTNDAPFARKGLSLRVRVYKWDDYDEAPVFENVMSIASIPANSSISLPYSFAKPVQPYAYSLRFDVLEQNQSKSFYDLRFVSPGAGGRIVRLTPLSVSLKKDSFFGVAYAIVGSADASSVAPTVSFKVTSAGQELYSNSSLVDTLNSNGREVENNVIGFVPTQSYDDFTVNAELRGPGNALLDSYSKTFHASEFAGGDAIPYDIRVVFNSTSNDSSLAPVIESSTGFYFYSSNDYTGLLCTNALVTVSGKSGAFTLYAGVLENKAQKQFANLDKLPAGVYEFKVKCYNSKDLHQKQLGFTQTVRLTGALAPTSITSTPEPTPNEVITSSTPIPEQSKENNWLVLVGSLILIVSLAGLYFFFKRGDSQ